MQSSRAAFSSLHTQHGFGLSVVCVVGGACAVAAAREESVSCASYVRRKGGKGRDERREAAGEDILGSIFFRSDGWVRERRAVVVRGESAVGEFGWGGGCGCRKVAWVVVIVDLSMIRDRPGHRSCIFRWVRFGWVGRGTGSMRQDGWRHPGRGHVIPLRVNGGVNNVDLRINLSSLYPCHKNQKSYRSLR